MTLQEAKQEIERLRQREASLLAELLRADIEALDKKHMGDDYKIPDRHDMASFLLVNAIRFLDDERLSGLCFDLYVRSKSQSDIDKRINEYKEQ